MQIFLLSGLFNALWITSVAGGNPGALLCLPLLLYFIFTHPAPLRIYILQFSALGCLFDGLLFFSGQLHSTYFPLWLIVLWFIFFTFMPACLQGLRAYPRLLRIFSALGGPLAYYSGSLLGDLQANMAAYIAMSIFWAIFLPFSLEHYEKVIHHSDNNPAYPTPVGRG